MNLLETKKKINLDNFAALVIGESETEEFIWPKNHVTQVTCPVMTPAP